jgi:purine-binding chemotaxis protein CheW
MNIVEKNQKMTSAPPIDWEKVHRRLEEMQAKLDSDFEPSPEDIKALLKKRAAALAREDQVKEKPGERITVVEFLLAEECYGIETIWLREAYPLRDLTPLPGTPAFMLGLINLRGRLLSVIDIKKFFNLPAKGISDLNKVIVLQKEKMEMGILADAIIGVREVGLSDLQSALPAITGVGAEYLKGVTPKRLIVLDAERILDDPNIIINDTTSKGGL